MDSKFDFLAARATTTVKTRIGDFTVRELSVKEMNEVFSQKKEDKDVVFQLSLMIVDPETGKRIFTTAEDLKNLAEMPGSVSTQLFDAVNKLNGIDEKGAEEAAKN